jgi:hypothetical protein
VRVGVITTGLQYNISRKDTFMGREIRKVPPNWEHPKEQKYGRNWRTGEFEETNEYKPLFDRSFEDKAQEWIDEAALWLKGEHEDQLDLTCTAGKYPKTYRAYSEWQGDFPDKDLYRPEWTDEECTAYQIYETVTEGTPVSPVFQTQQAIIDWLIDQGHTSHAAVQFVKGGWAPTMLMRVQPDGTGEYGVGIDSFDVK